MTQIDATRKTATNPNFSWVDELKSIVVGGTMIAM
jgi:hypothetical protein